MEAAESLRTTGGGGTWESESSFSGHLSNFLKGARGGAGRGGALYLNFLKEVPQFGRICGRGERGGEKRGGGPQFSEQIAPFRPTRFSA